VGHPLDTIKVRIQTMEVVPGQPAPYKGMVDCASQIIKKEGVRALAQTRARPPPRGRVTMPASTR